MRILVTNDDGILAPGIAALQAALSEVGEVAVVAPETTQSAMGHAISVLTPIYVRRFHVNSEFWGWAVDGRPADCVKMAILEILPWRPDFVVSGINHGLNTGINVLYSGTVAGAAEGAFFRIPSMAVSLELSKELDFHAAGRIARALFERYVASSPAPGTCISVNIPALDQGMPLGVRLCPQATVPMDDMYSKQDGTDGRTIYLLDGKFPLKGHEADSDVAAIRERYVSITPLRFDLTDAKALQQLSRHSWPQAFE